MERGKQKVISDASQKLLEQILAKKKNYTCQQSRRELRTIDKNASLGDIIDYLITQQKDFKKQGIIGG